MLKGALISLLKKYDNDKGMTINIDDIKRIELLKKFLQSPVIKILLDNEEIPFNDFKKFVTQEKISFDKLFSENWMRENHSNKLFSVFKHSAGLFFQFKHLTDYQTQYLNEPPTSIPMDTFASNEQPQGLIGTLPFELREKIASYLGPKDSDTADILPSYYF